MVRTLRSHAVVVMVGLSLGACATKPILVTPEQRTQFGRVRVVTTEGPPRVAVSGPTPLGGVGGGVTGAALGLTVGIVSGMGCFATAGYGLPFCASAVATPYWIGRGVVDGARKAIPESERRQHTATVRDTVAETDQNAALVARIADEGKRRAAPLSGDDAADSVAEVTLKMRLDTTPTPSRGSSRSVWTLSVPDVDPALSFIAETRLRVLATSDQRLLLEKTYVHRGYRAAKLGEWANGDIDALRTERDQAIETLALQIADDLFGAALAPADEKPAPAVGAADDVTTKPDREATTGPAGDDL